MIRAPKILLILSLLSLTLSYPACQWGEARVKLEMARYPAEFVAAHEFDMIFMRWVLPGIWLFLSGLLFGSLAVLLWLLRKRIK